MRTSKKLFLMNVAVLFSLIAQAQTPKPEKSMDEMWGEKSLRKTIVDKNKSKLFDESNFGMFIHMGLFSHLGGKWDNKTYYGIGEWIMNSRMANIPVDEYKAIAKEYNPKNFDAKQIVKVAKDAGMKYIIITSKHHEGFAMFNSEVDSFNIVTATPYAKDPMKELSAECRKQGLGFGFYYSHNQDWTAPGGTRGLKTYPNGTPATFEDYFYKKCLPQVREICTNYGQIDFVWFDTPGDMKKELIRELVETVNKLQPNAMLCSRVGYGYGDYVSQGDMEVPLRNISGLWETCDTNNDSWSYAWYDTNFKSPKELLNRLVSTVARGGTYLLNVGPDGNGVIPAIGAKFLKEVGVWIKKYPQVVYKAGSSPWGHAFPWGDVTSNGDKLYLSVFEWPADGRIYLPGLTEKNLQIRVLGQKNGNLLKYEQSNGWTIIEAPLSGFDLPATVIEVKLGINADKLKVDTLFGVAPNIDTNISAEFANVTNATKKSIRWMEKFGEWKHALQVSNWEANGLVTWDVDVQKAGFYYIDLRYRGENKIVWKITTDERKILQNQQSATEKYQLYSMGIIEFKKPGKHSISVSLVEGNPINSSLGSIQIRPVKL